MVSRMERRKQIQVLAAALRDSGIASQFPPAWKGASVSEAALLLWAEKLLDAITSDAYLMVRIGAPAREPDYDDIVDHIVREYADTFAKLS